MYSGTTISGTVEASNERGLKLNGDWLNVSKFRPLELPPIGSHVSVVVDAKGFLSAITLLEQVEKTPAVVSRNETITRLAVLKAAANFVGLLSQTREDVKSEHVLLLADRWLAWVDQPTPSIKSSEEAF